MGEFAPALFGRLGEIGLRLLHRDLGDGRVQLGFRGEKFGVEFRRVDRGERLPGLYVVADVDEPLGDIAVDPGVDRRFVPGRRFAGSVRDRLASVDSADITVTVGASAAESRVAEASWTSAPDF